ncbi:hypothetical protein BLNAU_9472 [Blattamonas nauphoetae]|uniref:Uncharacterized protein n=1 Tax=Blattamonas nauphoetae TaxID=2049346 RepID=A0ABQ9XVW2_9EUKA|nr:hypothetical protein BLNAU_9472 [Blattamonas nauphoetae]
METSPSNSIFSVMRLWSLLWKTIAESFIEGAWRIHPQPKDGQSQEESDFQFYVGRIAYLTSLLQNELETAPNLPTQSVSGYLISLPSLPLLCLIAELGKHNLGDENEPSYAQRAISTLGQNVIQPIVLCLHTLSPTKEQNQLNASLALAFLNDLEGHNEVEDTPDAVSESFFAMIESQPLFDSTEEDDVPLQTIDEERTLELGRDYSAQAKGGGTADNATQSAAGVLATIILKDPARHLPRLFRLIDSKSSLQQRRNGLIVFDELIKRGSNDILSLHSNTNPTKNPKDEQRQSTSASNLFNHIFVFLINRLSDQNLSIRSSVARFFSVADPIEVIPHLFLRLNHADERVRDSSMKALNSCLHGGPTNSQEHQNVGQVGSSELNETARLRNLHDFVTDAEKTTNTFDEQSFSHGQLAIIVFLDQWFHPNHRLSSDRFIVPNSPADINRHSSHQIPQRQNDNTSIITLTLSGWMSEMGNSAWKSLFEVIERTLIPSIVDGKNPINSHPIVSHFGKEDVTLFVEFIKVLVSFVPRTYPQPSTDRMNLMDVCTCFVMPLLRSLLFTLHSRMETEFDIQDAPLAIVLPLILLTLFPRSLSLALEHHPSTFIFDGMVALFVSILAPQTFADRSSTKIPKVFTKCRISSPQITRLVADLYGRFSSTFLISPSSTSLPNLLLSFYDPSSTSSADLVQRLASLTTVRPVLLSVCQLLTAEETQIFQWNASVVQCGISEPRPSSDGLKDLVTWLMGVVDTIDGLEFRSFTPKLGTDLQFVRVGCIDALALLVNLSIPESLHSQNRRIQLIEISNDHPTLSNDKHHMDNPLFGIVSVIVPQQSSVHTQHFEPISDSSSSIRPKTNATQCLVSFSKRFLPNAQPPIASLFTQAFDTYVRDLVAMTINLLRDANEISRCSINPNPSKISLKTCAIQLAGIIFLTGSFKEEKPIVESSFLPKKEEIILPFQKTEKEDDVIVVYGELVLKIRDALVYMTKIETDTSLISSANQLLQSSGLLDTI